jgi:hypothetical protein
MASDVAQTGSVQESRRPRQHGKRSEAIDCGARIWATATDLLQSELIAHS